ncbi:Uu.00g095020.m01.CDS01 [Anthostomella pinea]|uniref:Uu.00g095020.m01.CDS01 n=1 Tax=Anthostomella pinea TaxID=933095 RepID=A0AAI8VNQ9_9PEZI|nr:Uu.00g095020.m01.CDS01 [Anthostomella pinea]
MSSQLLTFQPFKGVYILLLLLTPIPYLACLSLLYVSRPLRPLPGWPHKLCMRVAIIRVFTRGVATIKYQRAPLLTPGKAKERFALVEPPVNGFSGVLVSSTVKPAPVGVLWHPGIFQADRRDLTGKRVVLQFTGGAFVLGWDPEETGRDFADVMSRRFQATNTLYVQYRLARPGSCFPAALQDTLTAYSYVLDLGVAPEDIFLSGGSAGGNLVIALLRYLETQQAKFPLPRGVMLFSPWVKVSRDAGQEYDRSAASQVDVLYGPLLDWGVRAYMPTGDVSPEVGPFISPLNHPFRARTPIFIQTGTGEAFYPTIRSFAEEMTAVEGNCVRLHKSALAPHDILMSQKILGLEFQLEDALDDARNFFDQAKLERSGREVGG